MSSTARDGGLRVVPTCSMETERVFHGQLPTAQAVSGQAHVLVNLARAHAKVSRGPARTVEGVVDGGERGALRDMDHNVIPGIAFATAREIACTNPGGSATGQVVGVVTQRIGGIVIGTARGTRRGRTLG